jgi:MFS family permease
MDSNKKKPRKTGFDEPKGLRMVFRALEHRNYRLFFGGQGISLIGTWMQRIAMSWLVYRLTNSAFLLGLVAFMSSIPTFILAPFAGVLADRWNLQRSLIITQTMAMIQALILAVLTLTGLISLIHILILSAVLGFINALDMPMRQSFVVEMVEDKKDLGNAIALNSSLVNSARLFGPAIAGMVIVAVGEGICFLINGLSYLAVIASLWSMKIAPKTENAQSTHIWEDLREGLSYVYRFIPIRSLLLLLSLVSLMGVPYTTLMPIFAKDILHGNSRTLGFLMGCSGIGALIGAIFLASRRSILGLGKVIIAASSIFGIGLITFSLSHFPLLSFGLMLVTGFGMMVQMASTNTVLQTIVDEDKRGRVMSFYAVALRGIAPIGALLAGFMASTLGAANTLLIGGTSCIAGSLLFAGKLTLLRQMVRPIYIKKDIIPAQPAKNPADSK